jgi:uncharacterized protein YdaU (DUF1376 family)
MANQKPPAFQLYTKDFLASESVSLMTDQERGWYIFLLCHAWNSEPVGTLPNNLEKLRRLAGCDDQQAWDTQNTNVLCTFVEQGERIVNNRLVEQFAGMEERRHFRSQNGKKGGRPKAGVKAAAKLEESDAKGGESSSSALAFTSSTSNEMNEWIDGIDPQEGQDTQTEQSDPGPIPTQPHQDFVPNPEAQHLAAQLCFLLDEPRDSQKTDAWARAVAALLNGKRAEAEIHSLMEWAVKENPYSVEYLTKARDPMACFVKNYDSLFRHWKAHQKSKAAKAAVSLGSAKEETIPSDIEDDMVSSKGFTIEEDIDI